MESVKTVKNWVMVSYYGAIILGGLLGILFGVVMLMVVTTVGAQAHQSKTLTLDKDFVISGIRICEYSHDRSFDSTQVKATEKCPAVLVVDAGY